MRITATETYYKASTPILEARAHHVAIITGFPQDELRSEADVLFMKAVRKWNPDRTATGTASFSTFLFRVVHNGLLSYTRAECRAPAPDYEWDADTAIHPAATRPDDAAGWKDELASMGEDARNVVALVLEAPAELIDLLRCYAPTNGAFRTALTKFLTRHWGWTRPRAVAVFDEIRKVVNPA